MKLFPFVGDHRATGRNLYPLLLPNFQSRWCEPDSHVIVRIVLCSSDFNVAPVQGLIQAEQARRWRCAAAVLCSVGWRVDPQLFNIQDLQTLGDRVAALTAAAQAAPTN